jgi:Autotransporter beta-domain
LNKRALMLIAALALFSGNAYGATPNPNPPCTLSTATTDPSTTTPQLCEIITGISLPLYTGDANPNLTSAQQYSGLGNLTLTSPGTLSIGTSPPDAPAITLNSGTSGAGQTLVTVGTSATVSYVNVTDAVGVLMEEATPNTATGYGVADSIVGEFFDDGGTINLTGSGTNKVGILFAGSAYYNSTTSGTYGDASSGIYPNTAYTVASPTSPSNLGVFTGALNADGQGSTAPVAVYLASGSVLEVQGTSSYGVELIGPTYSTTTTSQPSGGATLIGDIDIGGSLEMTPTTVGSTVESENVAIDIAGWLPSTAQPTNPALAGTSYAGTAYAMVGNINVGNGGLISSEGQDAEGIQVLGAIYGGIVNDGSIETFGTTSPSTATNAADPEAGPAIVIADTVTGGILNNGPYTKGGGATATATISTAGNTAGTGTIYISPNANLLYQQPITIGVVDAPPYSGQFSLVNLGSILSTYEDANISTTGVRIIGSAADTVTLSGGIFNSGSIQSSAITNTASPSSVVDSTALAIGNYVTVNTGTGGIDPATVSTPITATLINSDETGSGRIVATVSGPDTGTATAISIGAPTTIFQSIFNDGTIEAIATTTTLTQTGTLSAQAIVDYSGTLTTITNEGSIEAAATQLDNDEQTAVAINTSSNSTTSVVIKDLSTTTSSAAISGDIYFGSMPGTLTVAGTSQFAATVAGNPLIADSGVIVFNNEDTTHDDTLNIGSNATVTSEIEEKHDASVDIAIANAGALNLLTTQPTDLLSTLSGPVPQNIPLSVGTLTVNQGGTLNMSLSQGSNVPAYAGQNVTVIAANKVNIQGDGIAPTIVLSFGSFVSSGSIGSSPSQFVLIDAPGSGTFTISSQELTLLTGTYDSALNPVAGKNGIPFLFTSNICTYNVTGATGYENCAVSAPTLSEPYNSTDQELVLQLTPKTVGTGANQIPLTGFAAKMFPYANQALINDNTLGAAMLADVTSNPTAQAAYASFAPDVSGATRATAISLTDSATNVVAARQRELRMYANQEGGTTLWGQQFGERLSQGNGDGLTGYNDSGFGFVMGMDEGDPADGHYGGALTFFAGGMSQKEPTSAKTASEYYILTGYTDWRGKGLFLDTQLSVGYGTLKGKRYLTLNPVGETIVDCASYSLCRTAEGDRPTELLSGGVTAGAIFNAGGTVLMPQLSVDGLTSREEGYSENGGGQGFDLRVQPYYANSLRAFLGIDMRQDINFGDFYLQPELRTGYRYDFVDGAVKLKANFASVNPSDDQPLNVFTVEGPDPGRGNLVLGGGLATTTGSWSIGVNYDYLRAGNGPTEQTGIITLVGKI